MSINYANTNMLTGVEFNNWQNTYTTVQTNSSTWSSVISGATYTRWQLTGNPPISSFSISGATSNDANAYRVTVGSVLQDPASYTVTNFPGTITFSEAPELSSNIIVLESIIGFGSNGTVASTVISNSANWQSTYSTVQTNSSTWGTGGGGSFTVEDANAIIGLSMFL